MTLTTSLRRNYNRKALRIGQQKACETIENRVKARQRFISVVLPTRYGKTDVIRATAGQLVTTGHACCALVITPGATLRDQIVDKDKINEMIARISPDFEIKTFTIKKYVYDPGANGEWLLPVTTQLANRNLDIFKSWVELKIRQTGKPVLVYIDEAHMGSAVNQWGQIARVLTEAGAIAILVTATPYRADGKFIHGFNVVQVSEDEEFSKYVNRPGSRPDLIRISFYEGTRALVRLQADYEYTLAEAWNETPLPIAKIGRDPFDVNLSELIGGDTMMLSELEPNAVRGCLGKIIRDPYVVTEGCRRLVSQLTEFRLRDAAIKGIVFCGNDKDDDPQNDSHLRMVRDTIKSLSPNLKVLMSTTASDEEDDGAMTRFLHGEGDIIIVKQRGSLGIDYPPLKVALDLSSVRTRVAFYQRMMRIATYYKGIQGCYIWPKDQIADAHFNTIVTDNGGEFAVTKLEEVSSVEVHKGDAKLKPGKYWDVNGTGGADFDDSDLCWAEKDMMAKVQAAIVEMPELIGVMTHARIATLIEKGSIAVSVPTDRTPTEFASDIEIHNLQTKITTKMSETINLDRIQRGLHKDSEEKYGTTASAWYGQLHKMSGSHPSMEIRQVTKIETLNKWLKNATIMFVSMLSKGNTDETQD